MERDHQIQHVKPFGWLALTQDRKAPLPQDEARAIQFNMEIRHSNWPSFRKAINMKRERNPENASGQLGNGDRGSWDGSRQIGFPPLANFGGRLRMGEQPRLRKLADGFPTARGLAGLRVCPVTECGDSR